MAAAPRKLLLKDGQTKDLAQWGFGKSFSSVVAAKTGSDVTEVASAATTSSSARENQQFDGSSKQGKAAIHSRKTNAKKPEHKTMPASKAPKPTTSLDLGDLILASQRKEKAKAKQQQKPKKLAPRHETVKVNPLDSSAPTQRRGKERVNPKRKKPSKTKQLLEAEKTEKAARRAREEQAQAQAASAAPVAGPQPPTDTMAAATTAAATTAESDRVPERVSDHTAPGHEDAVQDSVSLSHGVGNEQTNAAADGHLSDAIEVEKPSVSSSPNHDDTDDNRHDDNADKQHDDNADKQPTEPDTISMLSASSFNPDARSFVPSMEPSVPSSPTPSVLSSLSTSSLPPVHYNIPGAPRGLMIPSPMAYDLNSGLPLAMDASGMAIPVIPVMPVMMDPRMSPTRSRTSSAASRSSLPSNPRSREGSFTADPRRRSSAGSRGRHGRRRSVSENSIPDSDGSMPARNTSYFFPVKCPELHSSRFREYCTHGLNRELDETVKFMLSESVRFHKRAMENNQIKAKARKRYVTGMKEVRRSLRGDKVKVLIVAPDVQRTNTKGGLDDQLQTLFALAEEHSVPVIFALSRAKLARVMHQRNNVTAVALLHVDSLEPQLKTILKLRSALEKEYLKRQAAASAKRKVEGMIADARDDVAPELEQLSPQSGGGAAPSATMAGSDTSSINSMRDATVETNGASASLTANPAATIDER
eukprot:TRINITY_DN9292_c0_g1_i1.p1 TRINITY_DN9292_c0_g1~~TRINITY_DN9292_c0_g1_i1.p1  ORF type:complete len:702 (+),score=157.48 TRINITY_DN9292_c0_g1_i1:878-2983(+)